MDRRFLTRSPPCPALARLPTARSCSMCLLLRLTLPRSRQRCRLRSLLRATVRALPSLALVFSRVPSASRRRLCRRIWATSQAVFCARSLRAISQRSTARPRAVRCSSFSSRLCSRAPLSRSRLWSTPPSPRRWPRSLFCFRLRAGATCSTWLAQRLRLPSRTTRA
eukprot:Amastigsp_a511374_167.p4 type:complete len:166 gc:universal Amastigsp_a511374_167:187-684(+)